MLNTLSSRIPRSSDMERELISFIISHLLQLPDQRCKSVSLANALLETFGIDIITWIRKEFNGFLHLIECYPEFFVVERIPSNDYVSLIAPFSYIMDVLPETQSYLAYPGFCSPSSCLHVGNLNRKTKKKDLIEYFSQYGQVKSVRIKLQRERRIAFIEFGTIEEAVFIKRIAGRSDLWKGYLQYAKREKQQQHCQRQEWVLSIYTHVRY